MTEQDRELVRALRCAATPMTGDEPCKTCRYNKKRGVERARMGEL